MCPKIHTEDKKRYLPIAPLWHFGREMRDFSERYCNITAVLYNKVLGKMSFAPVCCRSDLYDMQNMYQE